jgi:hypothetical protein
LGDQPVADLRALEEAVGQRALPITQVLVFSRDGRPTGSAFVRHAREALISVLPDCRFVGGTSDWFVTLNRERPDTSDLDGIAWSVTPAVHAEDDLTMIEALAAQTAQAITARSFAGAAPLLIGPITLQPNLGPPATSADARHSRQVTAAWTAGSIRAQALGGVRSATYFQTVGADGVVSRESSDPYPCYHVIKAASSWRGWPLRASATSDGLVADALIVQNPVQREDVQGLVMNYTPNPLEVEIVGSKTPTVFALAPWEVQRVRGEALALGAQQPGDWTPVVRWHRVAP